MRVVVKHETQFHGGNGQERQGGQGRFPGRQVLTDAHLAKTMSSGVGGCGTLELWWCLHVHTAGFGQMSLYARS